MHFGKKLVITTLATGLALTPVTSVLPNTSLTNYTVKAEAAALSEQDYIDQVQAAFNTLYEDEKENIRAVRDYLLVQDTAWWKSTINDAEFDAKIAELEASSTITEEAVYDMIKDLVLVFYGVGDIGNNTDTFKAKVDSFKQEHATTFDALFGAEVTVEYLLEFANQVQQNAAAALVDLLEAKLAQLLGEAPAVPVTIDYIIDSSIENTFASGFEDLRGKLTNLGLSVDDLKGIRSKLQVKLVESGVNETIPARNAMIGAFARANSSIEFKNADDSIVSSVYKDTNYTLWYSLSDQLQVPADIDRSLLEENINFLQSFGELTYVLVNQDTAATLNGKNFAATSTGTVEIKSILNINNHDLIVGRQTVEVTAAPSGGIGGGGGFPGGGGTVEEPGDEGPQPDNPSIIDESSEPIDVPSSVDTSVDENGLTTATASVDEGAVLEQIKDKAEPVDLQVIVEEKASVMTVSLSADFVTKLVEKNAKNTITMVAENGTITVPSVDLGASINKLTAENANMSEAKILISFAKANQTEADTFAREALNQDMVQLTPTTIVKAEVAIGETKHQIQSFNSYVKFTFNFDGNNPAKNIVGIQWNQANQTTAKAMVKAASIKGEVVSIPTIIKTVDGKTLITVKQRSLVPFMVVSNSKTFTDVDSTFWGKEDIELLATKMVVNGRTTDRFEPNGQLTRAEFATMLVRAIGLNKQMEVGTEYSDINGSEWYVGYVGAASAAGIINGYNDGSFKPNNKVTREEAASMVVRAIDFLGGEIDLTTEETAAELAKFNDSAAISSWAKAYVAENAKVGIIQGKGSNNFDPTADATRAESVAMVKRFMKLTNLISE